MDNKKAIDDFLKAKKLTREELELFKDIIQETKDREEQITQLSRQARESCVRLFAEINIFFEKTAILSRTLAQTLDEMETNYLRSLPADRFYRE
ncbi:MAG: hypothetical protein NTX75_03125 [Proteobacteria bacterium]|nr:hypothetical protein [Pseudomonadota bacterium]